MKVAMVRRRRAAIRARRPCCVPVADAHVTARQRAFNGYKLLTPIFADAFDDKVDVAPHPARRYRRHCFVRRSQCVVPIVCRRAKS